MISSDAALSRREASPRDADGRVADISQLFREYNRTLVLFLAARVKDVQTAQELAQEAYVRLLQLDKPAAVSFLRAYLFKTALNLAIDRQRQQQLRARTDATQGIGELSEESPAERTLIAREELALLGRLISELPEKYQQAFYLHRIQDQSFEDVAWTMGLKERMVRRYIANTLLYLRLRRDGASPEEAWRQLHL